MTEKKEEKLKPRLPQHKTYPARLAFRVDEHHLEIHKLNEVAQLIRLPASLSEEDKNASIARALDLYESLAPASGLEGMLAAQMVGTHHAALECLRMAAVPEQTFAGRDMNLKHAAKLMALYTQQLAALDKHRGKGQQKVTVEHVHVAPGGQAIVGNVETGASSRRQSTDPDAIEHKPEVPLTPDRLKRKTASRKSKEE
jgi:hypothetical protein